METISSKRLGALLSDNANKNSLPMNGIFELTPFCNLDCKMCYVHLSDPTVKERVISGQRWITIMGEAISCGMLNVLLTGGEAMIHPDFWDIYMYLVEQGVSVTLKTNGILLTAEAIRRFQEYPPWGIDVSLYGCDGESYQAVTGHDVFETVTRNLRAAIDAGLRMRVLVTPSAYMSPWTFRVMEYAKTFGVKVKVNQYLDEPYSDTGRHKENFDLTEEETAAILKKTSILFPPNYLTPEEEAEIYIGTEKRPDVVEKGLHCNGGRTGFALSWDGILSPCLAFPREIVGADVLSQGFEPAWRSVNRAVRDYSVPKECFDCPIHTYCHYCPVMHRRYAVEHRCDPEACSWWKKRYEEKRENNSSSGT